MTTARQEAIKARTLAIQDALTGLDRDLSDVEMDAIDAAHPIPPRKKPSKRKSLSAAEIEAAKAGPTKTVTVRPDGVIEIEPRDVPEDAAAIAEAEHDPNPKHQQEQPRRNPNTGEPLPPPAHPICVAVLSFDTGPDRIMIISSPKWLEQAADTMPGDRFIYGVGQQGERWGFRLNTLRQWTCRIVTPTPPTLKDMAREAFEAGAQSERGKT